jgi:hypothetical protein
MTAQHPSNTAAPIDLPADPRPAWERVAYTWLAREVDGDHQVDPAALATEVSVNPQLAADLVQVLRAQRQRDPGLAELRGRLVRDRITNTYLAQELRGGAALDPAELARPGRYHHHACAAVAAHPAGRPLGRPAPCHAAHPADQSWPANR